MDRPLRRKLRTIASVVLVNAAILAGGIVLIEIALRVLAPLPVHGGSYLDDQGNPTRVSADAVVLRPNLRVTHLASEFSKTITTNRLGYRTAPGDGSPEPDFLFLGDSFTFGHGVADNETAVFVFCTARRVRCQNLGRSGTGTFDQIEVLRHALEPRQIRPKVVVLVMFASCWLGSSGNDLSANLAHRHHSEALPVVRADFLPALGGLTKWLQPHVGNFEITKRTMMVFAGPLKLGSFSCSAPEELAAASAATRSALEQLDGLAKRASFTVKVVSLHPYQELNGYFSATEAAIKPALPQSFGYVPTASRFRPEHYYPYDGHLNAAGQANLAAILNEAL